MMNGNGRDMLKNLLNLGLNISDIIPKERFGKKIIKKLD